MIYVIIYIKIECCDIDMVGLHLSIFTIVRKYKCDLNLSCNVSMFTCLTQSMFIYPVHLELQWKLSLIPLMRQSRAPLPCPLQTSFITSVHLLKLFVYLCPFCELFERRTVLFIFVSPATRHNAFAQWMNKWMRLKLWTQQL